MDNTTFRKPYRRPVKSSWWLQRREYVFYMIREATAVVNLWVAVELTAIILCTAMCEDSAARITAFLGHPATIAANGIALLATIFHTVTWYSIFPKGVRIFTSRDPSNTRLVPSGWLTASLYLVTVAASVVIVCALLFA